ncbi:RNA degradosome polyphosphate kinase [Alteribacter natronophilus]|uniref:RNA degradosome polyphosphate kinase n=1 Tax=Alteribacter natronophilus TaxID=2583810 RepID=UPI00110DEEC7|nr:RNA degradosome polyphosphate kinase [Alteribacter natronophilus]TMW73829.1 RNA degradosome polyphosphate kinase [Alteribacter natronophilus]
MTKNAVEEVNVNVDLHNPSFYNNRELSWLGFNQRVLEEAEDDGNPLLERLKFAAIFSSNLDEFFMVRVAGLKDQVKAGFNKPENKAGLTPKQQLARISEKNHLLTSRQDQLFTGTLIPQLNSENIHFPGIDDLNDEQLTYIEKRFDQYILPVLTPMAIDAYRPFPMLLNKSLNLAVVLRGEREKLAIVQVPAVLTRYIQVPPSDGKKTEFVLLEDVISHFIGRLFAGYKVKSVSPFRITRNADLTIHEEGARDLLRVIEKELKKRKWGAAVRLEMQKGKMDSKVLSFLTNVLEIHHGDVYETDSPLDLSFLFSLYNLLAPEHEHLVNETLIPNPPADLVEEEDIFEAALKQDLFFHHPYESFQPIVDWITRAARDPAVLAIKQTLYRVSGDSPIINALAEAAEQGKQVTVLVELKARFDEENNIQWARKLEKSGVHVIYGITGLKTHSKITLIVRHNHGKIERFVHLGTGNYNDSTAKLYTDMGMITSDEAFGYDATNFFNHLSGFSKKPKWKKIHTAPFGIRDEFIRLIDSEIRYQKKHGNGRIIAKMNSLTDKPIILKLYEASRAGVKIDLIVRGICCLKPGIPEVSDNITVRSIVDRFLEHSRIFYFHQNGKDATYLSSADWMTRNMEKRIEILFPIERGSIKRRIREVLEITLEDNRKARIQLATGEYTVPRRDTEEPPVQSQLVFHELSSEIADCGDD